MADARSDFSRLADLLTELTEFLSEADEASADGESTIEFLRVALPLEFDVRGDEAGGITAIESLPPERTGTSFIPVFHALRLSVEVENAGDREPGVES
jgi:hypothetical protein